jgi:hypothetical protein
MITKLLSDQVVKTSPFCGAIHEILTGAEYSPSIALAIDIRETVPHFHKTFDEIYFVVDGEIRADSARPRERQDDRAEASRRRALRDHEGRPSQSCRFVREEPLMRHLRPAFRRQRRAQIRDAGGAAN